MDLKPLKVSGTVFSTNSNKKPVTSSQQAKQTSYKHIFSFSELLEDLMLEQREQM